MTSKVNLKGEKIQKAEARQIGVFFRKLAEQVIQ